MQPPDCMRIARVQHKVHDREIQLAGIRHDGQISGRTDASSAVLADSERGEHRFEAGKRSRSETGCG